MELHTASSRARHLLPLGLMALLVMSVTACGSPVSPDAIVNGPSLPARFSGDWHGTSARQISGPEQRWNLENLLLRADGSAEITEYEGSQRRDTGTWSIVDGNVVVIDFMSFCDRRGRVDSETLTLTCETSLRTWETVFIRP